MVYIDHDEERKAYFLMMAQRFFLDCDFKAFRRPANALIFIATILEADLTAGTVDYLFCNFSVEDAIADTLVDLFLKNPRCP